MKVHVHYNGRWEEKSGSDRYTGGDLQYLLLQETFTPEDINKQAAGLPGLKQGPDFAVYGLVLVPVTGCRQRILITGQETLNAYVEDAPGIPSFFLIASRKEASQQITVDRTPTTPATSNLTRVCSTGNTPSSGNTPSTPLARTSISRVNSSIGDNSSVVRRHRPSHTGSANEYVSKAKRSLESTWETPFSINLPRLHDAPSNPKPVPTSPPPEPFRQLKWYELCENQRFKTKNLVSLAVAMVDILDFVRTRVKVSRLHAVSYVCDDPTKQCRWAMWVKHLPELTWWVVTKVAAPHTCCTEDKMDPTVRIRVKARALGKLFSKKFAQCDIVYTPKQLIQDMWNDHGIPINYRQAYAGCKRGTEAVRGSPDDSYQYLVTYSEMLKLNNKHTVTAIHTDANGAFMYYFFALGACLHGFKTWCRPAFGVDATHLSGDGYGILLSAVSFDANNNIFPIAFAIVDSENKEACQWFMQQLFDALGKEFSSKENLVVCTDRSQSIEHGVSTVFTKACHVYCAYHLKVNILKRFHNPRAADEFMIAALAYNVDVYRKAMSEVTKCPKIRKFVEEIGARHWARIHCKTDRYIFMTTNLNESWNARLLDARKLPITHLVDCIRSQIMVWFSERRDLAQKNNATLSDFAEKIIEGRWKLACSFDIKKIRDGEFQVDEVVNTDQHYVNMKKKFCSCKLFNYEHLPCPHALAVAIKTRISYVPLCGGYYSRYKWRQLYAPGINPVLCKELWVEPEDAPKVLPPIRPAPEKGRPKRQRYMSASEKAGKGRIKRRCSYCREPGHYEKTCPQK